MKTFNKSQNSKKSGFNKKRIIFLLSTLIFSVFFAACGIVEPCSPEFLVAAVDAAQIGTGRSPVTINLEAGCVYTFSEVNNSLLDGRNHNGLPIVIHETIIHGNGATIRRDVSDGEVNFRMFNVSEGGILRLDNLTIEDGSAGVFFGGAILVNEGGQLFVENVIFQNNSAEKGGAIEVRVSAEVTISNSEFIGNTVRRDGGALEILGVATIVDSTFRDNVAGDPSTGSTFFQGNGGAIFMASGSGELSISGSTFYNNQAGYLGGALSALVGTVNAENSTFSGNSAHIGGAISNSASLSLNYVTIFNNTAAENGGGLSTNVASGTGGRVVVMNSIIAENMAENCTIEAGPFTAVDNNLHDDSTCTGFTVESEPMLSPLADNGGPTETHALIGGSLAIDAASGECIAVDQRNSSRPYNSICDLGAYEFNALDTAETTSNTDSDIPSQPDTPPQNTANKDTPCSKGPGSQYELVSFLQQGDVVVITGTGFQPGWLVVDNLIFPGVSCWVEEGDVDVDPTVDLSDLKIIAIPSLPTDTPEPTPTPCVPNQNKKCP